MNNCPGCRNHNEFCLEHQKHEKEVYETVLDHGTKEYHDAILKARTKDLIGD